MPKLLRTRATTDWRAVAAEFIATGLFVWAGCGSAIASQKWTSTKDFNSSELISISLGFGLAITTLAYGFGHISGGHMNPAVTFSFMWLQSIDLKTGLLYMVAQFGGACFGSLLLWGCTASLVYYCDSPDAATLITSNVCAASRTSDGTGYGPPFGLGANQLWPRVTNGCGFLVEAIGTYILVITVLNAAVHKNSTASNAAPIAIGWAVLIAHLVLVPLTGCGINPARSFGPLLVDSIAGLNKWTRGWWVFFTAPFVGSLFATLTAQFIFQVNPMANEADVADESDDERARESAQIVLGTEKGGKCKPGVQPHEKRSEEEKNVRIGEGEMCVLIDEEQTKRSDGSGPGQENSKSIQAIDYLIECKGKELLRLENDLVDSKQGWEGDANLLDLEMGSKQNELLAENTTTKPEVITLLDLGKGPPNSEHDELPTENNLIEYKVSMLSDRVKVSEQRELSSETKCEPNPLPNLGYETSQSELSYEESSTQEEENAPLDVGKSADLSELTTDNNLNHVEEIDPREADKGTEESDLPDESSLTGDEGSGSVDLEKGSNGNELSNETLLAGHNRDEESVDLEKGVSENELQNETISTDDKEYEELGGVKKQVEESEELTAKN